MKFGNQGVQKTLPNGRVKILQPAATERLARDRSSAAPSPPREKNPKAQAGVTWIQSWGNPGCPYTASSTPTAAVANANRQSAREEF